MLELECRKAGVEEPGRQRVRRGAKDSRSGREQGVANGAGAGGVEREKGDKDYANQKMGGSHLGGVGGRMIKFY